MREVKVFVGTRKGGLSFSSDEARQQWSCSDLHFKAWNVLHMNLDLRDHRLHVSAAHDVFGPSTHYSDDFGETWTQAERPPAFDVPSTSGRPLGSPVEARKPDEAVQEPEKVIQTWNITPGRGSEPDVLYAGVQPAALFKSNDRGQTWKINEGLYHHPHRETWFPGAGGLALHTILPHPTNLRRMWVAISTGGCYHTNDGGVTWNPRNKNVRADFLPSYFPEYGQCVHKMALHPSQPERLYQQNHCGVYRSDNGGLEWIDIGEGKLDSRFGFPLVVHPHDPDTIYIVPEESDQFRVSVDGKFRVWRSCDKGETWQSLRKGLPDRAYLVVLRGAMAVDTFEESGIYVGTSTGQVFHSRDAGDHWELLADFLPPIYSIETAVID
jgi:hypothetical protein